MHCYETEVVILTGTGKIHFGRGRRERRAYWESGRSTTTAHRDGCDFEASAASEILSEPTNKA